MENEIVKKEPNKKLLENKYTYLVFILVASFFLNLLGGEISIVSILGTLIGSLIFAYPIYYIYQAMRYRRWNVGDKHLFEIRVLQVASILTLLICFSTLLVAFSATKNTSSNSKNENATLESSLVIASDEMNKDLPAMVDKTTQLTSTSASGNELSFSYKILNDVKITQASLSSSLGKGMTNQACTTPETKNFLEAGAKFVYIYYDNNGQYVGKISLSAADCKL